jgi:hypothetical protein
MADTTTTPGAPPAWRTVITAAAAMAVQLTGFYIGSKRGWDQYATSAFGYLCFWSTFAAIGQAAKSTFEVLGKGSGLKGVANVVMTDAKPGEPAEKKE